MSNKRYDQTTEQAWQYTSEQTMPYTSEQTMLHTSEQVKPCTKSVSKLLVLQTSHPQHGHFHYSNRMMTWIKISCEKFVVPLHDQNLTLSAQSWNF